MSTTWLSSSPSTLPTSCLPRNKKIIEEIAERTSAIERGVEELVNARKLANKIENERDKAIAYHDKVEPYLDKIRYEIDKLESSSTTRSGRCPSIVNCCSSDSKLCKRLHIVDV